MAPGKVARLLAPLLKDPDLGKHVVAAVADLSTGDVVFQQGATARPASTTKLLTAVAALHVLGPDHRFTTSVVLEGRGKKRRVVLVGGGDPYLASKPAAKDEPAYPERADLRTLARLTADALAEQGIRRAGLGYDDTLFTGPRRQPAAGSPATCPTASSPDPGALGRRGPAGVRLRPGAGPLADGGDVLRPGAARGRRPRDGTTGTTSRGRRRHAGRRGRGPPVSQIVERMLTVSDNEAAEVLAHQVGLATVGEASFAGGVRGVRQALTELGVPLPDAQWYDGSGLSRENVLAPETLLAVLRVAASADHPELRAVLTGLPVAGFTGSLEYRFVDTAPAARGRVRAKTGTLRDTSSLAGIATDLDGTSVAFVLMADRVPFLKSLLAQQALDAVAAALGGCHCSVGSGP